MAWIHLLVSVSADFGMSLTERYVRMVGSPALYNVGADYLEGDPTLVQKRGASSS
jgi:hypothetical protein